MRLIHITLFLMASVTFSEEPLTMDIIYVPQVRYPFHSMHSLEEIKKNKEKDEKKQIDLRDHIVVRERKIPVCDYLSFTVPDTKIVWPSFISQDEKTFWRQTLHQFAEFSLEPYPRKNEGRVANMANDTLWRAFLSSAFPHMDLVLYLKPCDNDFPLIIIFNKGKIIAVDYEKFSSVKEQKYNSSLKKGDISEFYSDGMDMSKKWKHLFDISLVERKVDKKSYDDLCHFFSKTVELGKPLQYQLEDALRIYKTDVNSIRKEINLNPRPTFNDGQYLFIMDKKGMVSFHLLELYQPEEFPGMVCDLTFSLWNACVAPDKNKFPSEKILDKYKQTLFKLQKQEELFGK